MSLVLRVVGALWAALGAYLIVTPDDGPSSEYEPALSLIVNTLLFVLPGLALWGIGARVRKPRSDQRGTRACPFCAERIKAEARICKHCQRDLTPIEMKTPAA